jgi:hypothetical protein
MGSRCGCRFGRSGDPTAASSKSAMRHSSEWLAETVLPWNLASARPHRIGGSVIFAR